MICNKCNQKLPDDSEFCQFCGSKIEPQNEATSIENTPVISTPTSTKHPKNQKNRYCSRCGSLIDNETRICTGCGKKYFGGKRTAAFIKKLFVILLLCAIFVTSLAVCYDIAYQEGWDYGYDVGYNNGYDDRSKLQKEDALAEYERGYEDGCERVFALFDPDTKVEGITHDEHARVWHVIKKLM